MTNQGNVAVTDIMKTPQPSREKRQRSVTDAFFTRLVPSWSQSASLSPAQWRAWAASQPVASTCKETMVSNLTALDWKITPRKSDQRDELKGSIDHYERFFRLGGHSGLDWVGFLEWFLADLLDLPFGTGWEVGRKGDEPAGRAAWLEPIDGGTLYPTNNKDFPVMQVYGVQSVIFPAHAIARAYMSPRPEIERKGWGIAPPEKAFLAMEMLAIGDRYYANLLLDIPPVGILDLMDVTWDDAQTWVESFRTFAGGGGGGFRIPVLAEHTGEAKFIPLGKNPNDIMYESITLKYAALTTAAYGMTLSDIGLQGSSASGETLAGAIRGEQKTNRTGKAKNKAKIKYFIESILPHTLQFDFIDTDGERLAMIGRARLANATAMNAYHQMAAISPTEARLQAIQDGLFTISMPEEPPPDAQPPMPTVAGKKPPERPASVGSPQPPSLGGDGEVKKSAVEFKSLPSTLNKAVESIVSIFAPVVQQALIDVGEDDMDVMRSTFRDSIFSDESIEESLNLLSKPVGQFYFGRIGDEFESLLLEEGLYPVNVEDNVDSLKRNIEQNFPAFLSKAIAYVMTSSEYIMDESLLLVDVKETINRSLRDYVSAYVGIEVQNAIEEARKGELEVPEFVRLRAVSRKSPMVSNVTVESPVMPPINITIPERSIIEPAKKEDDMQIIINNPANVDVANRETFETLKSLTDRVWELKDAVIASPPQVTVNLPEQLAPIVNLSVPENAPQIVVNVPEQPFPTINVTNEVNPTPVQIDVNVPAPKDKKITIVKHGDVWTGEAESKEE